MLIFKWSGIDLTGRIHGGLDFASSSKALELILLQRKIGLIHCKKTRKKLTNYTINTGLQLSLFNDLRALLQAGVPLPQALQILVNQTTHPIMRCVLGYLLYQVREEGVPLGTVLSQVKPNFGSLVIVALQSGFMAGNFDSALHDVCVYLSHRQRSQRELRRSLLMPGLTFFLFIAVAVFIFGVVVPQFETLFDTISLPPDDTTRWILEASAFLRSQAALIVSGVLWLALVSIYALTRFGPGQRLWHYFVLKLPVIGLLVLHQNRFRFLQSAALLISGGVETVIAYNQAHSGIHNVILARQCGQMIKLITQGTPVSIAMRDGAPLLFPPELISLIAIGEETGCLGAMLERGSEIYQQRFSHSLQIILLLIQPTLIVLLGALVALLIFAVYIPIFNLPTMME